MNRTLLVLFVGVGALGVAGTAHAQEAGRVVEGVGYPVGEGTVLHPTVGSELGFTDNVFYADSDRRAAGLLRLVAEFAIASKEIEKDVVDETFLEGEDAPAEPASQRIKFRAGGLLRYTEFLSGDSFVRTQRDLGADLSANMVVAPEGRVSFSADEHFIRDTRPVNFYSTDGTNRIANSLALGLMYQPGGRTMKGGVKWENQIDYFEDEDQRFANRMINSFHAKYEWALFPYTKIFADASYSFIGGFSSDGGALPPAKRSSSPIRGGAGIATALTEMFTVKAHVGWAYASYAGGSGYNTPVLGTEIGYRYSPVGRIVFDYAWDHRDSVNGDFYSDHGLGVHIDQQLGRVVASAGGELHLRSYHGIATGIGAPDRSDLIIAATAKANYVFRDWLAAVGEFRAEADQTDYMSVGGDDPSYSRIEITAGIRAAF
jgi:hypothetical protein